MRPITADSDLKQLHAVGRGYVYNDFSGRGVSADNNNVLHRASCRWILSSNTNVPKYFFDNVDEAIAWLMTERGQEGRGWRRCKCVGKVLVSRVVPRASKTVEAALAVFREPEVERLLINYYVKHGYNVQPRVRVSNGIIDIVATKSTEKIVVEVKGEDAGGYASAEMNFHIGFAQIASRMNARGVSYALGVPDTLHYQRVLRKFVGSFAFEALELRLLVVDAQGDVRQYVSSEIQSYIASLR